MSRSSAGKRSRYRYACVVADRWPTGCRRSWKASPRAGSTPSQRLNRSQPPRARARPPIFAERVEPRGLAVLLERLQRVRCRRGQRRRRIHRSQRFSGLASQCSRELVGGVDQTARPVAGFAERRELAARVGADEPDRDDVSARHTRDVTVDDGLDPLALRDLPRDARVDARVRRALHELERRDDFAPAARA